MCSTEGFQGLPLLNAWFFLKNSFIPRMLVPYHHRHHRIQRGGVTTNSNGLWLGWWRCWKGLCGCLWWCGCGWVERCVRIQADERERLQLPLHRLYYRPLTTSIEVNRCWYNLAKKSPLWHPLTLEVIIIFVIGLIGQSWKLHTAVHCAEVDQTWLNGAGTSGIIVIIIIIYFVRWHRDG